MTKPYNSHEQNTAASKDQDDVLSELYKRRKVTNQSPNSVKQNMLNNLASAQQLSKPWWKVNLLAYLQISAVCCTAALAFIVISLQMIDKEPQLNAFQTLYLKDYQTIEIHELAQANTELTGTTVARLEYEESLRTNPLSSPFKTEQRQVQYEQAQSIYLAKKSNLRVHQQSYAMVVQNDGGLSLLTCDKHLLKLSQQVVDLLLSDHTGDTIDFSQGSMLALGFDSQGHIIDITQKDVKTQCS